MRHPGGESITVTRVGPVIADQYDEQGNPLHGADTTFVIDDVAIAPTGTEETVDAPGVFVVTGYDLFCPYDTPALIASDRLTIRGVAGWQMLGESTAAGWRNPFDGVGRGVVIAVKRGT